MAKKKEDTQELEALIISPARDDQMTVLMVAEYEGFHYYIQEIGQLRGRRRLYQYIIFDPEDKKFYQTYITIKPRPKEAFLNKDLLNALVTMQKMAETTIEELIKMRDPDYEPEGEAKEYEELAKDVIRTLEANEK